MSSDPTRAFLESLPSVHPKEQFVFACHPKVPCFNACCSDLMMPLTPYDVLRLCHGLDMSSEAFIEEYATVSHYLDTGFPFMSLRMDDSTPNRLCPFVTQKGCGIYGHRSSACRTYPLGRATKASETSKTPIESTTITIEEQYFLIKEAHCKGFYESNSWTSTAWLSDQGLIRYNQMNDRYTQIIARYKIVSNNALLSGKHATMALLALYQQDRFLEFITSINLFSRIKFIGTWGNIPEDIQHEKILLDPEKRLLFGFEWVELVLFGNASGITPR